MALNNLRRLICREKQRNQKKKKKKKARGFRRSNGSLSKLKGKLVKYWDLVRGLKKLWNMKVTVIPIIIGRLETILKNLVCHKKISVPRCKLLLLDRNTWNYITVCTFLVLYRNTWNHIIAWNTGKYITVGKLLVLDRNTWNHISVWKQMTIIILV